MLVVQKDKNLCQIIDFACRYNGRVDTKDLDKTEHYQDLARELRKIWNMKVRNTLGSARNKIAVK